MFSGITEEMGVVKAFHRSLAGAKASVLSSVVLQALRLGESVSVSGVCLTVVDASEYEFSVDISTETLEVTTMGDLKVGIPVNLERAIKFNERIGGHLVTGHVDAVGVIRDRRQDDNTILVTIEASEAILCYCILKGSIAVDGVSLTINHVSEKSFEVALIPHTAKVTTLGVKAPGSLVNLESDLVGKYVERLLRTSGYFSQKPTQAINSDYLKKRRLT